VEQVALIDSSAFLALLDKNDRYFEEASRIMVRLVEGRWRLFTTNYILAESQALILNTIGADIARKWLISFDITVIHAKHRDEERAKEIIANYIDKDFSLCDAISFSVMENLGVSRAFAFDRHFRQYPGIALVES